MQLAVTSISVTFIFVVLLAFIMSSPESWSSSSSGWHDRSTPLSPSTPIRKEDALFAVTRNAMGGHFFILGLFQPDIAVNRAGQILRLQTSDFVAFAKLSESWTDYQNDHSKKNYRIQHNRTCRPFTILHIPTADGLDTTSVYGFSKDKQELERGAGLLPNALRELLGLAGEADRADSAAINHEILHKVKEIGRQNP